MLCSCTDDGLRRSALRPRCYCVCQCTDSAHVEQALCAAFHCSSVSADVCVVLWPCVWVCVRSSVRMQPVWRSLMFSFLFSFLFLCFCVFCCQGYLISVQLSLRQCTGERGCHLQPTTGESSSPFLGSFFFLPDKGPVFASILLCQFSLCF